MPVLSCSLSLHPCPLLLPVTPCLPPSKYVKTHNVGVFDVYTDEMVTARHEGILTGLPDAYGRGRIIGDYRRVALYGADALIEAKESDKEALGPTMTEDVMRLREEVSEQIRALKEMKQVGGGERGRGRDDGMCVVSQEYGHADYIIVAVTLLSHCSAAITSTGGRPWCGLFVSGFNSRVSSPVGLCPLFIHCL